MHLGFGLEVLGLSTAITGLIFWGLAPANSLPEEIGTKTFFVGLPITAVGLILDLANRAEVRFLSPDSDAD